MSEGIDSETDVQEPDLEELTGEGCPEGIRNVGCRDGYSGGASE